MDVPDEPPGDLHLPRDILSRALRQSERISILMKSERWQHSGGDAHSGLRSSALALAKLIAHLVARSETANAAEFEVLVDVVGFLTPELHGVICELLEL